MKNAAYTLEDCLEILTGLKGQDAFDVDPSDRSFLLSIARQVAKGVGFTDRQHEAVREKLEHYRTQFTALDYDVDSAVDNLRIPLRQIDRSRWIKILERKDQVWIAVRFVFQKKLISKIDELKQVSVETDYDAENKIHFFPFNESNVYKVVSIFKDVNNFDVQPELLEYYNKLEHMKHNKQDHVPGIYSLSLKNLHEKNLSYAVSSVGEPDINNLCRFYDQRERLGLYHFDDEDLAQSMKPLSALTAKIANRKHFQVVVDPKQYTVEQLAETVLELYRFPLLIALDEKHCYDELSMFHRAFSGVIPNESCSVLFRLDSAEGAEFNEYVRHNNLNSSVDTHTKVVYISNNKIPKPLLKTDWHPSAAVTTYSGYVGGNKVDTLLDALDLVIHYDNEVSPWKRNRIEKI